jgi:hypothetical protein
LIRGIAGLIEGRKANGREEGSTEGALRQVAGLGEVSCDSVENYDVSGIVHAHGKYRRQTGAVFDLVGLEQCDRAPSVERDDEQ